MAGHLLVVNDEPHTGYALREALTLHGFDVTLASAAAAQAARLGLLEP